MTEYPKWRTHPTMGPIIVTDAEHEATLFAPDVVPDPAPVVPVRRKTPKPTPVSRPKPGYVQRPTVKKKVKHK